MQASNRQSFGQLLVTIGELYNKQVNPVLSKLYWRILEPYDWQDVVSAFQAHVQDPDCGQFMPKPADIIRAIKGNSQTQSLQAWTKVSDAIRLIGPYRSVVFDDVGIHVVLQEMGGWIKICNTKEKEFPFVAQEFQTRYRSYTNKEVKIYPHYLSGICEHQNGLLGIKDLTPVFIGDQYKAQRIFTIQAQSTLALEGA